MVGKNWTVLTIGAFSGLHELSLGSSHEDPLLLRSKTPCQLNDFGTFFISVVNKCLVDDYLPITLHILAVPQREQLYSMGLFYNFAIFCTWHLHEFLGAYWLASKILRHANEWFFHWESRRWRTSSFLFLDMMHAWKKKSFSYGIFGFFFPKRIFHSRFKRWWSYKHTSDQDLSRKLNPSTLKLGAPPTINRALIEGRDWENE